MSKRKAAKAAKVNRASAPASVAAANATAAGAQTATQANATAVNEKAAAREVAKASGPVKVTADRVGYYDNKRRREGDVFTIANKAELGSWMRVVDAATPEKLTTGQQEIHKAHDVAVNEMLAAKAAGTGGANPLGAE